MSLRYLGQRLADFIKVKNVIDDDPNSVPSCKAVDDSISDINSLLSSINDQLVNIAKNLVKTEVISGTSDTQGNVYLGKSMYNAMVIATAVPSAAYVSQPMLFENGNWYATVLNLNGRTPAGNIAVSVRYYYIDIS